MQPFCFVLALLVSTADFRVRFWLDTDELDGRFGLGLNQPDRRIGLAADLPTPVFNTEVSNDLGSRAKPEVYPFYDEAYNYPRAVHLTANDRLNAGLVGITDATIPIFGALADFLQRLAARIPVVVDRLADLRPRTAPQVQITPVKRSSSALGA